MEKQRRSDASHAHPNRSPKTAPTRRALAAMSTALLPLAAGCSVLSRLDYGNLFNRGGWQHTDRVVQTLEIRPGARIADMGAGDGYFSFVFADAVGPSGVVYAVDIDAEKLDGLRAEIAERGVANIEVVEALPDDARLPAGAVDLAFFCNAYHHFHDRVRYMTRLREALAPGARVAIVDGKREGAARIFIPSGHSLPPGELEDELEDAGYALEATYDFLPLQTFEVFAVSAE